MHHALITHKLTTCANSARKLGISSNTLHARGKGRPKCSGLLLDSGNLKQQLSSSQLFYPLPNFSCWRLEVILWKVIVVGRSSLILLKCWHASFWSLGLVFPSFALLIINISTQMSAHISSYSCCNKSFENWNGCCITKYIIKKIKLELVNIVYMNPVI